MADLEQYEPLKARLKVYYDATLDTLIDYGRPRAIRLAVLVDRGHRELPVAANVIGKVVATSRREDIQVRLRPSDDSDGVWLGREEPDDS